ncbi:MAG: GNAT family N-acetyltransferase [Oscillospiraceae bacterium]|jgi:GNAT superfamily N-acetyltransferase|nr:GNAT family N-acetyltransferase [Oscillospiraceae bacterium]MCI1990223.1 GNAT family N-acetyltransferase [Oscillospiraceae bacterium]MCI2036285.1 GNAT family N-acetyltransferase [Oscillospiraceae bacterium]
MLKLLTSKQPDVPDSTPFGCKIRSAAAAYGLTEPFEQFWAQDGGTVVARIDDEAVLVEGERTDTDELRAFLRTLDLKALSCEAETAEHLGIPVSARGEIMVLHPQNIDRRTLADVVYDPGPREIYSLLEQAQSKTFPVPEFEPFYMDLSFRTRHRAALTAGVRQGGRLAACALCLAITERAAVISAVACVPGLRLHGYGRTAVTALVTKLRRDNMYLFRAENENEAFYRKLGFEPYGFWAEYRRP